MKRQASIIPPKSVALRHFPELDIVGSLLKCKLPRFHKYSSSMFECNSGFCASEPHGSQWNLRSEDINTIEERDSQTVDLRSIFLTLALGALATPCRDRCSVASTHIVAHNQQKLQFAEPSETPWSRGRGELMSF